MKGPFAASPARTLVALGVAAGVVGLLNVALDNWLSGAVLVAIGVALVVAGRRRGA